MPNEQLVKFNPANLAAIIGKEALVEVNDNFAGGISGGDFLPLLSIRGNRFRLRIDGDEKVLPDLAVEVFLLDSRPNVSKMFYSNGYDPNSDDKKPTCSSADGVYPDDTIDNPVSSTCQLCPNAAWGSKINNVTGKKGKACQDFKMIVLALAAMPEAAFALRIPAGSLKTWQAYIKQLTMMGLPATLAKTRIGLSDETEYASLEFTAVGTVESKDQYEQLTELANSFEVKNAVQIKPRAQAPQLETHAAQQPVVVETPAPVVEAPKQDGIADLLTKSKAKKKTEKVETPADTETTEESGAEVSSLNDLLAKMKKK
jgi:hypothetical protein